MVYLALAIVIAGCVPLEQENIEVSPITNDTDLQIPINIIDDGDLITFESDSTTIGRVLTDANLDIYVNNERNLNRENSEDKTLHSITIM